MSNYRMLIQYDGTRYNGWQRQPGTDNTIQGKIEDILSRMAPNQPYPIHVTSAGRTDAGVHALGQVANVHLETSMEPEEIRNYLNQYLPEDIGIVSVEYASERFHARLNASHKTYCYRIAVDPSRHVLERKYMTPLAEFSRRIRDTTDISDFDLDAMRTAARVLPGTHDFAGFCTRRTKKSTTRTLSSVEIKDLDGEIRILVTGDGFLYNMVRILVGTLMEVGFHRRTPESIKDILEQADRNLAGMTAPARGLALLEVFYS